MALEKTAISLLEKIYTIFFVSECEKDLNSGVMKHYWWCSIFLLNSKNNKSNGQNKFKSSKSNGQNKFKFSKNITVEINSNFQQKNKGKNKFKFSKNNGQNKFKFSENNGQNKFKFSKNYGKNKFKLSKK